MTSDPVPAPRTGDHARADHTMPLPARLQALFSPQGASLPRKREIKEMASACDDTAGLAPINSYAVGSSKYQLLPFVLRLPKHFLAPAPGIGDIPGIERPLRSAEANISALRSTGRLARCRERRHWYPQSSGTQFVRGPGAVSIRYQCSRPRGSFSFPWAKPII